MLTQAQPLVWPLSRHHGLQVPHRVRHQLVQRQADVIDRVHGLLSPGEGDGRRFAAGALLTAISPVNDVVAASPG